jgi:hypothetical protein
MAFRQLKRNIKKIFHKSTRRNNSNRLWRNQQMKHDDRVPRCVTVPSPENHHDAATMQSSIITMRSESEREEGHWTFPDFLTF